MHVVITGGEGFLGWHTRARLHLTTEHTFTSVDQHNIADLPALVKDADAVVHLAGVNSHGEEAEPGNIELAQTVADAVRGAGRPLRLVYTNTIHAATDTFYGRGKAGAEKVLRAVAEETDGHLVDVVLPNLFGEHGRPNYNSFVATFVQKVIDGETPTVQDKPIELLHAQAAAAAVVEGLTSEETQLRPQGHQTSVQDVLDRLLRYHECYPTRAEIPVLADALDVDLFNTYRAALFPQRYPLMLTQHSDPRGSFVEVARVAGGEGQSSFSTTVPGITRGEHVHLWKCERFCVVRGQARISLRKVCTDETVDFDVTGDQPCVVDMPTLWTHNITNTGDEELLTIFWINAFYDPANPDTYPEKVRPQGE